MGPDTAAALLVAAGDNPERIRSEAAWAHLCGAAPHASLVGQSDTSSTRPRWQSTGQHRAAPIVLVRIAHDPNTRAYFERRVKEGRSKLEIIRILKRYVAREVYRHLPRR